MFDGETFELGKAHPHRQHRPSDSGRRSGLRPYPPLAASRSFSIVAPAREPTEARVKFPLLLPSTPNPFPPPSLFENITLNS
jgi:hypothetical protein